MPPVRDPRVNKERDLSLNGSQRITRAQLNELSDDEMDPDDLGDFHSTVNSEDESPASPMPNVGRGRPPRRDDKRNRNRAPGPGRGAQPRDPIAELVDILRQGMVPPAQPPRYQMMMPSLGDTVEEFTADGDSMNCQRVARSICFRNRAT